MWLTAWRNGGMATCRWKNREMVPHSSSDNSATGSGGALGAPKNAAVSAGERGQSTQSEGAGRT